MLQKMMCVCIRINNTKHILSWRLLPRCKTKQCAHMSKKKKVKKKIIIILDDFVLCEEQELVRSLHLQTFFVENLRGIFSAV